MTEQNLRPLPGPGLVQDVEVDDIGGALSASEWDFSAPRARLGAHGFVLASGSGVVRLESGATGIEAPCVIWLPSGMSASVRLEAGARGVAMTVSDAALGRVVPASSIAGPLRQAIDRPLVGMRLEAAAARATIRDLEEIRRETLEDLPGMREAIMSRLCLVLIAFWRLGEVAAQPQAAPRVLVQNFLQLVELNARAQWRVADYARTMGISTDRLTSAIRRATGQSPLELVHGRLLEDAESLLERSALQVREIADALGFRDAGYFNRFFTRLKGISPGRYRQRAQRLRASPDGSYAAWP
ncbi:AraC family transcriptional regulator [Devosia ginsengisoli]|nr:AraC family transcriptional regulator [Devosia ginsengisoli]